MSLSFEELQVGQRWESTGRTLTEADLTIACMTRGDWHPIHADAERAFLSGKPLPDFMVKDSPRWGKVIRDTNVTTHQAGPNPSP